MFNEEYDNYIRNLVEKHPRSYFKTLKSKSNSHILDYINNCTPLLNDKKYLISTKVYWVLNKLTDFPKCKICGKPILKNIKINEGYPSHCCAKCLSDDPLVQKHKEDSYQKKYGEGIINPFQSKEVIKKIDQTNFKKYNKRRYTQTEEFKNIVSNNNEEINNKKYETYKLNNSFNESKIEYIIKNLLEKMFKNVKYQYRSNVYPFKCDFYIEDIDTYIEYNGTWTHGGHPFDKNNENDLKLLNIWKDKHNKYYDNAIYTWIELDPKKREIAKKNNINLKEFWNISEIEKWLGITIDLLEYPFNYKKLQREFDYYKNKEVDYLSPYVSHRNEIIKYFQQDTFFKKEKEIWKNDYEKRNKLIENRIKYLNKDEPQLTIDDILTGFKKSGIYYGYSHFNPLWFKWFIKKYDIRSCYDPCGGWGHRLLGGFQLEKYIYNDFSKETKKNVERIIEYFKIKNTITYNEDASIFNPTEKFDVMFTCPPYYNLEEYECGKFENREEFNKFIDSLFEVFKKHDECKTFGLIIREDLLGNHNNNYREKFIINKKDESYFDDKHNKNEEYLFIFEK